MYNMPRSNKIAICTTPTGRGTRRAAATSRPKAAEWKPSRTSCRPQSPCPSDKDGDYGACAHGAWASAVISAQVMGARTQVYQPP